MWPTLLLLAQIAIPAPTPSAFDTPLRMQITDVTGGFDFDLRGIEAEPTRPGREVLVYLPTLWVFSVGRWHESKHGVGGQLPGPGLCDEQWSLVQPPGAVWHYNATMDVTGDGLTDFVIYLQDGSMDVYAGRGLSTCR